MASTLTQVRYSLDQANALLPLLHSIATEIQERREEQRRLARLRDDLQAALTPEGLFHSLVEIDARLRELQLGLRESLRELEALGVEIRRLNPLTVHIPGSARSGDLVFCWQLGEGRIEHGHPAGDEQAPRRPLHLRLTPLEKQPRIDASGLRSDDLLPPDEHAA